MFVEVVKKVGQGAKTGAEETENVFESFGEGVEDLGRHLALPLEVLSRAARPRSGTPPGVSSSGLAAWECDDTGLSDVWLWHSMCHASGNHSSLARP